MTPRRIIGFDLGSNMGWAQLEDGRRLASGTWSLGKGRSRWCAARREIEGLLAGATFDHPCSDVAVAYERVTWAARSPSFAAVYYGLVALVEAATLDAGCECWAILPAHWKMAAVGHGNASKEAYIAAANERYGLGLTMKGEDEAAALGVAYAAWRDLGGEEILAVGQQGALL